MQGESDSCLSSGLEFSKGSAEKESLTLLHIKLKKLDAVLGVSSSRTHCGSIQILAMIAERL